MLYFLINRCELGLKNISDRPFPYCLQDVLTSLSLNIQDARGQCYDGAATMAGQKSGVASQIKQKNSKCLYTHCYGHALNLAVGDYVKSLKCLSETFDVVKEICKLVKKSPQRDTVLKNMRKESLNEERGVHAFCPTRWTVRGEALSSMINNYNELMELWDWSLANLKDTEMKARVRGVQAAMKTFDFFFGCMLGESLLRQTDNLSKSLQQTLISAAEGQVLAHLVAETIAKDRSTEHFNLLWDKVIKRCNQQSFPVEEPALPRKRRIPARFEDGNRETYHHPEVPKDMYRQVYFEAIDNIVAAILARFDQADYKVYINLQELLLKAVAQTNYESEIETVLNTYGDDLDEFALRTQLELLPRIASKNRYQSKMSIQDLFELVKSLDKPHQILLSQVIVVFKLILVMPATNAVSERSFSSLKRIKTYLRATTSEVRLNSLMLLHIHKERTDSLDLIKIANNFVATKEVRKDVFGTFTDLDSLGKSNKAVNVGVQTIS